MPATAKRGLPLSGYEPTFDPILWDTPEAIGSSNCYAYSVDDYNATRTQKSMPGARAGQTAPIDYTKCAQLRKRLLADNPGRIYAVQAKAPCGKGYYKIMMFVDGSGGHDGTGDFHFFKQHRDVMYKVGQGDTLAKIARFFGVPHDKLQNTSRPSLAATAPGDILLVPDANVWSHKMGTATGALLRDSCGKLIKDPRKACRKWSFNYNKACGSFCVKRGHMKTV